MARKMLTEAQKKKKEVDTLMEGWMSQAAEDHRRLANRFEKIGLTSEDIVSAKQKIDHSQQMRSSSADFMRDIFAKLDAVAEGTFGPHNLPGAAKKDDDSDEKDDDSAENDDDKDVKESKSCGCAKKECKGNCGTPGCKCGS